MTTALYRRYRPESFGEMIGQGQVTEPLMTALRGDRVGHAYLFSGPRGCGKTTSARILARCLNCAQGPTDTPCGECDSCIELGRGGGGSLDVVEIDAASHNGVDDARDLRERAIFAPARDRFKIFILDEAHMVTPQGFNALLKLVEEPPEHVKFIFATTEPEKVIGTIRSRTHHYPFRLVPPAAMLPYVEELCRTEGVEVEAGVLPLVIRAGGGSPRDTLSLLDQLIAGSESTAQGTVVRYDRAVALLGYTHAELLDEVIDAFAQQDAASAFAAVDRVVQTGQDPRRFVDDLLERLRDLIVIAATGEGAASVLRGVSGEDLARMTDQARVFGAARLSRTADVVISALDEMTGATSPRLQLELMIARVLAQTSADAGGPMPSHGAAPAGAAVSAASVAPAAATSRAADDVATPTETPRSARAEGGNPTDETSNLAEPAPPPADPPAPEQIARATVTLDSVQAAWPRVLERLESIRRSSWLIASATQVVDLDGDPAAPNLTLAFATASDLERFKPKAMGGADAHVDVRQAISDVLRVGVKFRTRLADPAPDAGEGGGAPSGPPSTAAEREADNAQQAPSRSDRGGPEGRGASAESEGREPRRDTAGESAEHGGRADPAPGGSDGAPRGVPRSRSGYSAAPVTEWAVAPIPASSDAAPDAQNSAASGTAVGAATSLAVDDEPEDVASAGVPVADAPARDGDVLPRTDLVDEPEDDEVPLDTAADDQGAALRAETTFRTHGVERVGEAVVRQVLGATFLREEPHESPTRFG
ncbi:DNA polymerase III subunit gamma and tau [Microbacterium koreense]|uniref:DNA polymerase III subunit gamma/tau n=1 Tax=Microbacterium koreense TaxID=323761 RepID=A0ABW2ZQB6_9MICO